MDLVITQWNKIWRLEDLWSDTELQEANESDLSDMWLDILRHRKFATIPDFYGIGTAFVRNPSTTEGQVYKNLCDYMRMEMLVLMERIHCIQVEAFSRRDNSTKWWALGVLRLNLFKLVKEDASLGSELSLS
jgi:hypothetical protein